MGTGNKINWLFSQRFLSDQVRSSNFGRPLFFARLARRLGSSPGRFARSQRRFAARPRLGPRHGLPAASHFNLASNNYLMYLSLDGTTSIRSTDVTSVNQIKSYPNVSWSSSAITYTVPINEFCEKAFLVQIDSNTYAICELTIRQAPNNSKRDVTLYSIIYKNGV